MRNVNVRPARVTATLVYPNSEKKLFLTFEGKNTEYCIVIENDEAKRLQARLKTLFGDNFDNKGMKLEL